MKKYLAITLVIGSVLLCAVLYLNVFVDRRRDILKHILQIQTLPKFEILDYGEDVWTDEIYCFALQIPKENMKMILAGRDWQKREVIQVVKTMHINPPVIINSEIQYLYNNANTRIEISVSTDGTTIIDYSSD